MAFPLLLMFALPMSNIDAWTVRPRLAVPIRRFIIANADGPALAVGYPVKLEFNLKNVDTVLDEVRPYLISDGGNIKVIRVDENSKDVFVELQGACGSCPSSTTTMKMGVEVCFC